MSVSESDPLISNATAAGADDVPEALPFELGQRVVIRTTGDRVVVAGIRKSPIEGWIFTVEGDGIRFDLRQCYLVADIGW